MISEETDKILWNLIEPLSEDDKVDMLYCSMRASLTDKEIRKVIKNIKTRIKYPITDSNSYKELKDFIVSEFKEYEVIKKHAYKISYFDNDHATVSIYVDKANRRTYYKFLNDIKRTYEVIEYAVYEHNSYATSLEIKFKDDEEYCKEMLIKSKRNS